MKAIIAAALALASGAAAADSFVNGGFETGDASGWTVGGGSRSGQDVSALSPSQYQPGGSRYSAPIATSHSSIIGTGASDPNVGAALGSLVYSGNYSWRVEDTTTGGYVSTLSQKVNNYTDSNIFFAWKAVLENGGHTPEQSAAMIILLRDDTTNEDLITRRYNATTSSGGADPRFSLSGDLFYTPQWQIEQLSIDASRLGHAFELIVLAADCAPAGHTGYVYMDGFGGVLPPPVDPGTNVPVPGSLALMALGLGVIPAMRRRKA